MSRKPVVTRTLKSTFVVANVANIGEGVIVRKEVRLPSVYKDDKALVKATSAKVDTDTEKVVGIVSYEVRTAKYVMPEEEFAKNATVVSTEPEE